MKEYTRYNTAVVGLQWGDEGKGKVIDFLVNSGDPMLDVKDMSKFDAVFRYQGGNNAGHTVVVGDKVYKFNLVPSAILNKNIDCVIGNGCVIDVKCLADEIRTLQKQGVDFSRFYISSHAHVIMDRHKDEDLKETTIGTTGRGIGPTYRSKISREGTRISDVVDFYFNLDEDVKFISQYISSQRYIVLKYNNKKVLFEGAQGTLLDIDHGTYPFVTSSSCSSGGTSPGTGIAPNKLKYVIGVMKAYTTRVGNGDFETEIFGDIAEKICEIGKEYGTVTGRKRRIGWLNMNDLFYAVNLNGVTDLVITKLDVLDSLDEIYVKDFDNQFIRFEGWKKSTRECFDMKDLPKKALDYIHFIEHNLGTSVLYVGNGPERSSMILC